MLFIHVCIVLMEHYLIAVIWIKSIQRNKVEIIIIRKTDEKYIDRFLKNTCIGLFSLIFLSQVYNPNKRPPPTLPSVSWRNIRLRRGKLSDPVS